MIKLNYKGKYFTRDDNAVHIGYNKVQEMIDETLNYLMRDNDNRSHYYTATGDALIIGFKYDDEITIFVTQKYSEACLLKDEDGRWSPVNWVEETERDYFENCSKDELIDMLMEQNQKRAEYVPSREV